MFSAFFKIWASLTSSKAKKKRKEENKILKDEKQRKIFKKKPHKKSSLKSSNDPKKIEEAKKHKKSRRLKVKARILNTIAAVMHFIEWIITIICTFIMSHLILCAVIFFACILIIASQLMSDNCTCKPVGLNGTGSTSSVLPSEVSNEVKVYKYLKDKGLDDIHIFSMMGNMHGESGAFQPSRKQGDVGNITDKSKNYTANANKYVFNNDEAAKKDFVDDGVGYGLAQWTFNTRKANLIESAKNKGVSIDDFNFQMDFLYEEISTGRDYVTAWKHFLDSTTISDCVHALVYEYEKSENQAGDHAKRTKYAEEFQAKKAEYESTIGSISSGNATGDLIVEEAKKYLGTPYLWGGTTPDGFDCSGFVQYVMKQVGISVSRTTETQVNDGTAIEEANLQPGDIVLIQDSDESSPHHVGIYVGNDQYIHSPQTGDVIKISGLQWYRDNKKKLICRRLVATDTAKVPDTNVTGSTAESSSTGSFPKYALTDEQKNFVAKLVSKEQGNKTGYYAEASLIANLTDFTGDENATPEKLMKKANSNWFGPVKRGEVKLGDTCDNADALQAVEDVIIQGRRTLPRYINEHDYIGDITQVENCTKEDRSSWKKHESKWYAKSGKVWITFYTYPDGVDGSSDPFGYDENAGKYKDTYGDFCYTIDGASQGSQGSGNTNSVSINAPDGYFYKNGVLYKIDPNCPIHGNKKGGNSDDSAVQQGGAAGSVGSFTETRGQFQGAWGDCSKYIADLPSDAQKVCNDLLPYVGQKPVNEGSENYGFTQDKWRAINGHGFVHYSQTSTNAGIALEPWGELPYRTTTGNTIRAAGCGAYTLSSILSTFEKKYINLPEVTIALYTHYARTGESLLNKYGYQKTGVYHCEDMTKLLKSIGYDARHGVKYMTKEQAIDCLKSDGMIIVVFHAGSKLGSMHTSGGHYVAIREYVEADDRFLIGSSTRFTPSEAANYAATWEEIKAANGSDGQWILIYPKT